MSLRLEGNAELSLPHRLDPTILLGVVNGLLSTNDILNSNDAPPSL
jgi:hypothetical protein